MPIHHAALGVLSTTLAKRPVSELNRLEDAVALCSLDMQLDFRFIWSAVCHHFTVFLSNFRNYFFGHYSPQRCSHFHRFSFAQTDFVCVCVSVSPARIDLGWDMNKWANALSEAVSGVKHQPIGPLSVALASLATHACADWRVYARLLLSQLEHNKRCIRDSCVHWQQQQRTKESNLGSGAALLWQMRFVIVFGQQRPKWHELHSQRHPARQMLTPRNKRIVATTALAIIIETFGQQSRSCRLVDFIFSCVYACVVFV